MSYLAFVRVVAGKQAIFETVILTHDQACVGIVLQCIQRLNFVVVQSGTAKHLTGKQCQYRNESEHRISATAAVRVKRGSITISFAPLLNFGFHRPAESRPGELQRRYRPSPSTRLAFLMSTQWLVIAPRPNVGARLATVGPCQTRAWLSTASIPSARGEFLC